MRYGCGMNDAIRSIQSQIEALKVQLSKARSEFPGDSVSDYEFRDESGAVMLSQLFGDHDDLLVIHNMGASCNYCTMWADGYSGYLRHLDRRTAFVMVSPDTPEQQRKLAQARGWTFRMVHDQDRKFTADMGFWTEKDGYWPGVSAFHRQADGTLLRTGSDVFGPGDDYNPVWRFFDLLKGGAGDFEPH